MERRVDRPIGKDYLERLKHQNRVKRENRQQALRDHVHEFRSKQHDDREKTWKIRAESEHKVRVLDQVDSILEANITKFPGEIFNQRGNPGEPSKHQANILEYWTDGSHSDGYSTSSVVRYVDTGYSSTSFKHGYGKGDNHDAELYAIARGLKEALLTIKVDPSCKARTVRVYTDSMANLEMLEQCNFIFLGPLVDGPRAIQDVIKYTNELISMSINVELHWVKGHNTCIGNRLADQAAWMSCVASKEEDAASPQNSTTSILVPGWISERGEDITQEYLYRRFADGARNPNKHITKRPDIRNVKIETMDVTSKEAKEVLGKYSKFSISCILDLTLPDLARSVFGDDSLVNGDSYTCQYIVRRNLTHRINSDRSWKELCKITSSDYDEFNLQLRNRIEVRGTVLEFPVFEMKATGSNEENVWCALGRLIKSASDTTDSERPTTSRFGPIEKVNTGSHADKIKENDDKFCRDREGPKIYLESLVLKYALMEERCRLLISWLSTENIDKLEFITGSIEFPTDELIGTTKEFSLPDFMTLLYKDIH